MSYSKTISTLNYIKFQYSYSEVLESIKLETESRAGKISDKDGSPMIEQFIMDDNEIEFFQKFIKDSIFDIGRVITNLTYGLGNAIFSSEGSNEIVGFYIVDHDYYNENWLTIIDKDVEQMIESFILMKWYQKCGLNDDYILYATNHKDLERILIDDIYEVRRPKIAEVGAVTPITYPSTSVIYNLDIQAAVEMTVAHSMGEDVYFVHAIKSDGVSIPGFDNLITDRGSTSITFTSGLEYLGATLLFIGASNGATTTTKVLILDPLDITANTRIAVSHSFGNTTYIVEAQTEQGLAIPNFDSLLLSRGSLIFEITSPIEYLQVTLMLTGIAT